VHLHVSGALEFLINDLVHSRTGLDERGGNDGQRPALFDVSCSAEESLWPMQGIGINTTGENLARSGHHGVVGAGQSGDGVEKNHDIFLVLDQALGLLNDHLGHLNMPGGGLIEGGCNHLTAHRALHLGDLLGALVDEQYDQGDLWMVGGDGMGNGLHHHRLAALGWCHQ